MRILGITGGIATGKSTVTRLFAELGAPTTSADALAHDLLAPGTETTQAVLKAFPSASDAADPIGCTIDRRALGRVIFADPNARRRLESLTHPAIIAALAAQAAAWRALPTPCAAALEIPLLFEAGLESLVDSIVVVACREETQIARLQARLSIGPAEARQQIAAQWPLAEKSANADYIITTDDGLENTRHQVQTLWDQLSGG
ncbi:MAG: dephospho-CoA kinase [Armatimonadota bacterium]|nr:dephospho-CoA kinase [Armatimonadota bacterium]